MEGTKPYVAWVAYAVDADFGEFWLLLSKLARHTQNLLKEPEVSIAISEPDSGTGDPQQLARLMLQGRVEKIAPEDGRYSEVRERYLQRFPDAEQWFEFGDFSLFRFVPVTGRYVEGFASTHRVDRERLKAVAANFK
jgi:hypothetical protein